MDVLLKSHEIQQNPKFSSGRPSRTCIRSVKQKWSKKGGLEFEDTAKNWTLWQL